MDLRGILVPELGKIIQLRHRLHQLAEASLKEYETSALIAQELSELGVEVECGVGGTGIIAEIAGSESGPTVALRADMDALPLQESSRLPYHSIHEGLSHACGHDGHMACLVGVARLLHACRDGLHGKVRFIFQPAEEISGGALAMVEQGVLRDPKPIAILSLHSWPGLPADTVASMPGPIMASCDAFTINVFGKGGHGARPHLARNPLKGIVNIVEALTTVAVDGVIVSPCMVRVGESRNIIADSGMLGGTVRALSPDVRSRALELLDDTARRIGRELDMAAVVHIQEGCPAVCNDRHLYDVFQSVSQKVLGADKVQRLPHPSMGSEDFGYYLEHVPGFYFRLGSGVDSQGLHTQDFDFNDASLETGILVLSEMVLSLCSEKRV